jgi:hypothetical protein
MYLWTYIAKVSWNIFWRNRLEVFNYIIKASSREHNTDHLVLHRMLISTFKEMFKILLNQQSYLFFHYSDSVFGSIHKIRIIIQNLCDLKEGLISMLFVFMCINRAMKPFEIAVRRQRNFLMYSHCEYGLLWSVQPLQLSSLTSSFLPLFFSIDFNTYFYTLYLHRCYVLWYCW